MFKRKVIGNLEHREMLFYKQRPSSCYLRSSFTQNSKHCSSTNPILIPLLLPPSLPVSTPNTVHHNRLTVCLPDSLDLTCSFSILFWISACEKAGSRDFAFVDAEEFSSLRFRLRLRCFAMRA